VKLEREKTSSPRFNVVAHFFIHFFTLRTMQLSLMKTTRPAGVIASRTATSKRNVSAPAVKEVFMPALSSTMTEGKIVSWLKAPGDKVTKGEALVVVESGT